MTKLKLYSAWYCPFAQRTWMALIHKGIDFEYIEIDPYDKNPKWMEISRGLGQVPVIYNAENDLYLPDSGRNLEYIDTQYHQNERLYPKSASQLADAKYWMDFQGRAIIPHMYRLLKAEPKSPAAILAQQELEDGLQSFTKQMHSFGAYFTGDKVSAIDIALAPFALRIEILLSHYRGYHLPTEGAVWQRYQKWWQAMKELAPLTATSTDIPDFESRLIEFYLPYTNGGGQQDVTDIK